MALKFIARVGQPVESTDLKSVKCGFESHLSYQCGCSRRNMLNLSKKDKYWLAGLLEGEGTFMEGPPSDPRAPVVQVSMTDEDVMERVATLLGYVCINPPLRNLAFKPIYIVRLRGKRAVELMQLLKLLMGKRRQEQIQRALACYKPKPHGVKLVIKQVREIRKRFNCGETNKELAKKFGVCFSTIRDVITRKTWKLT